MGSVREEIKDVVTKDRHDIDMYFDVPLEEMTPPSPDDRVDQIISLVCKRIEGAKLKPKEAYKAYTDGKKKWLNSKDSYKYDDETYALLNVARTQLQAILDVIKEE